MAEPRRTELVWAGKRTQVERIALPFQRAEAVNAPRGGDLFSALGDGGADGWRNKLIWGDNKLVMASLLQGDPSAGIESLAGKIDLIYIDPPFDTGADFSFRTQVGDEEVEKEPSVLEHLAYRDTWASGVGSYLNMLRDRLALIRELLADSGVLYLHLGPDMSAYGRLLADEVFGVDAFLNEIVWKRTPFSGSSKARSNKFPVNHDSVLFYAKAEGQYEFRHDYEEYSDDYKARFKYQDSRGFYRKTRIPSITRGREEG